MSTMKFVILDFLSEYLYNTGSLPLPQEVPIDFRVLPEFVLEDIIDYLLFIVRLGKFHAVE